MNIDTVFVVLVALLPVAWAFFLYKYHKKNRFKFGVKQIIDQVRFIPAITSLAYVVVAGGILLAYAQDWINLHTQSTSNLGYWLMHSGFPLFSAISNTVVAFKVYMWIMNVKLFTYSEQEKQWIEESKEKDRQWFKSKIDLWTGKKSGDV